MAQAQGGVPDLLPPELVKVFPPQLQKDTPPEARGGDKPFIGPGGDDEGGGHGDAVPAQDRQGKTLAAHQAAMTGANLLEAQDEVHGAGKISRTSWNRVTRINFSTLTRMRAQVGAVTNSFR